MRTWLQLMLVSLEASAAARAVGDSQVVTAGLSAVHAISFSLVMGGALLSNLRVMGAMFRDRPLPEIVRPATNGVFVGLAISVPTGVLLFAPRATTLAANPVFQLKLGLIVAAVAAQIVLTSPLARRGADGAGAVAIRGGVALCLWTGVAGAACALILLE